MRIISIFPVILLTPIPLPIRCYLPFFPVNFSLQRIKNKSINSLPYIRRKAHWLEVALLILISEIICFDFFIQDEYSFGENVLPKTGHIQRECFLVNAKDNKINMAKNKLFRLLFTSLLRLGNKTPFFCKRNNRILR